MSHRVPTRHNHVVKVKSETEYSPLFYAAQRVTALPISHCSLGYDLKSHQVFTVKRIFLCEIFATLILLQLHFNLCLI